jgi:hypothetical protein
MSTDAEKAAAEKLEAEKKAAEDAAAATANWPTGGYNSFIPLLFITVLAVLVICVDVSTICLVRANMIKCQYVLNTVYVMFMIYSWIKLIEKLPIYLAIMSGDSPRFAAFGT